MKRSNLHDGWSLRAVGGPVPPDLVDRDVPARVPGSTHLDLVAAGLIPDPYADRNEEALTWAHRVDWRYSTTFRAEAPRVGERVDLVFEGIDTAATVELNGEVLGRTANMHRGHRFDVGGSLRAGDNDLTVTLRSALAHAEEVEAELGWRQRAYPHPYNAIRKMACSFGWDWGPDPQTAGLWKPVGLERWDTARLAGVRPLVTVDADGTGRVDVPPRSTAPLDLADHLFEPADPRREVLIATAGGVRTHHLFRGDLDYHPTPFTADAVVDDMLVPLTAGEAHHFTVRTSEELPDPAALLHPRVLRCANASVIGVS